MLCQVQHDPTPSFLRRAASGIADKLARFAAR
jgi:hypothetical protein